MIDDPAGYRYLECDPDKAKAAKEAAAVARAKAGPPKKPGYAQTVEEFKANMEAENAKTAEERAAAKARAEALAATAEPLSAGAAASSITSSDSPRGPIQVKGYYRKDGTYVRPHTRKR
jgi:hypothetical protein